MPSGSVAVEWKVMVCPATGCAGDQVNEPPLGLSATVTEVEATLEAPWLSVTWSQTQYVPWLSGVVMLEPPGPKVVGCAPQLPDLTAQPKLRVSPASGSVDALPLNVTWSPLCGVA